MATKRIDFLAREPHHADHILPIWCALPKRLRGTFFASENSLPRLTAHGVEGRQASEIDEGGLTLVASYLDLKVARKHGRRVIYCEHGAGQSYEGNPSGSYIGAIDRAGAVATLVPGHDAARRHTAVHPAIRAYPIGVPKLDRHAKASRPGDDVVAISFHWNCRVIRETRGAFDHYKRALPLLAERFKVIGHGHPRIIRLLRPHYEAAGIEVVTDFDEVIERASVYCIDNSSTMYEWAALDRPVVVLNAPWYRRRIQHGLRFWSHADVGPQVWTPADLPVAIETALEDPPDVAARRREIAADVYAMPVGGATKAAVQCVKQLTEEWG